MKRRALLLACAGSLLSACGADDPSAGTARRTVRVDPVSVVDIADADPAADPLFEWPAGGARFSNGNILVVDAWGARVLLFDSTGALVRTIGRPGSGPGEYSTARWEGICAPDTAFVVDMGQMRRDVIDAHGKVTRTERLQPANAFHGCAADGSTYSWESRMAGLPDADDPPLRGELTLGRLGSAEQRKVGAFETWKYGPLRQRTTVALISDGFALATGASGAIAIHDRMGDLVRTFDSGLESRPATEAMYEASLEQFVDAFPGRDDRRQMAELIRQRFPKPDRTPAYQAVHADPHDLLWVVASFPGEGHTAIEVFEPAGARVGSIRLPVELTVFEVGERHLLGRHLDDEGLPHVALFDIDRSEEEAP